MPTTRESSAAPQLVANKAIVRSFIDAWNTRDFDRFDALMGQGAVLRIGGAVVPCDPQGTRSIAEAWTSAFPDWRFELLALLAEGGSVTGRAQLEVDQTFVDERGTASVVPDGWIRTVEAMDGQQAVSIHIYGTDIVTQQRSEFDPLTGTERVFRPPFAEADAADQAG